MVSGGGRLSDVVSAGAGTASLAGVVITALVASDVTHDYSTECFSEFGIENTVQWIRRSVVVAID